MILDRSQLMVLAAVCVVLPVSACAARGSRRPELPPGQTLISLLPDPETGAVGRAVVTGAGATVELAAARDSTVTVARRTPALVTTLSQSDVRTNFGEALAALPPAQRHFTLYFRFDSEELTEESRALAPEILRAVKERTLPDVLIVGHTDTTGRRAMNFELGLRRARVVAKLLREAGLDASSMNVVSHGETDLIVHTADGVFEPRNRRVDITVR